MRHPTAGRYSNRIKAWRPESALPVHVAPQYGPGIRETQILWEYRYLFKTFVQSVVWRQTRRAVPGLTACCPQSSMPTAAANSAGSTASWRRKPPFSKRRRSQGHSAAQRIGRRQRSHEFSVSWPASLCVRKTRNRQTRDALSAGAWFHGAFQDRTAWTGSCRISSRASVPPRPWWSGAAAIGGGGAEEAKSGRGKSRGSGIRTVWHGSSAGSAAWWTGRFRRSGCPARGKCPCILPRWGWAVHRYPGFRLGAYESSASSCPATADTFLQYRLHSDRGPAPLPMNITHCQYKSPNFILRSG